MDRREIKNQVDLVNSALEEKGYNPVMQIIGYILSEDPAYITAYQGARSRMAKIDRTELLRDILQTYFLSTNIEGYEHKQPFTGLEETQKIF